jgi:protoheme IX farnesyltransferase
MLGGKSLAQWIGITLELGKIRIAQLVTLSTATGFILANNQISLKLIAPVVGILFMALGSGALNQYQERERDALMSRTKDRPIPSGRLSTKVALIISIVFILIGIFVLYFGTNLTSLLIGLITIFWYNVVYTLLKRHSPMAVIPGSIIGALPPLVGWASTGKSIIAAQPIALALFFFIWQIPHFWLLLLKFGDDYKKGGYPSLTSILDNNQLGRLTFIWIVASAVALIFMPMFGLGNSIYTYIIMFIMGVILIWKSISLLKADEAKISFRMAFVSINVFILSVMFVLTIDRLLLCH